MVCRGDGSLRPLDLIVKKRDGLELSPAELHDLMRGIADGSIPDYQIAAWAMAVFLRGMTDQEAIDLTRAMATSGSAVDLSGIPGVTMDKHSTGGVGDKTTLVLAPLLAAAGLPVAKLAGRGLGFTGGTLDKLRSFPGLRVELSPAEFVAQVREVGVAIAGQTSDMAPADKRLYALRDVTGTVESLPLIAASVMSKKISGGADVIVLDVKVGNGALMKDGDAALHLARLMVTIGRGLGRRTAALITDMNQPLGWAVGNALEVREAIESLKGGGPPDLVDLCLALGTQALLLAGEVATPAEGRARLERHLHDGSALQRLRRLVAAQGGDARAIDEPDRLPEAPLRTVLPAASGGYLVAIDTAAVGRAAMLLGAGRETREAEIDLGVGLVLKRKLGERVQPDEPLVELYYRDADRGEAAQKTLAKAFTLAPTNVPPPPLIRTAI